MGDNSGLHRASVAQWIEYWPPKPRVVGSIPASRATFFPSSRRAPSRVISHLPARRDCIALLAVACAAAAQAQSGGSLAPVTVQGTYDNAVGTSDAASQGVVTSTLLQNRPTLRPAEILEFVPGLIVTQHSGDGKANQYFLRGFNLDHGTDFATTVNGLPVNMPSHGHGQGYSDLNFLIPELVDRIEYRKGPY